eukprot:scaffold7535_cov63-Attheya_sp.AAC.1
MLTWWAKITWHDKMRLVLLLGAALHLLVLLVEGTGMHQGRVQSGNEMSSKIFCLASRSFCLGIQYLCKHPVSMHSVTIAMFQSSDWIKIQSYDWIANIDSELLCDWVNVDVTG